MYTVIFILYFNLVKFGTFEILKYNQFKRLRFLFFNRIKFSFNTYLQNQNTISTKFILNVHIKIGHIQRYTI